MCGPVYASHCRHAGEQRAERSRPFGDQCESAGRLSQVGSEAVNRGEEYLRGTFEFRRAFIHYISYYIHVVLL